jgi:hypothetical protein
VGFSETTCFVLNFVNFVKKSFFISAPAQEANGKFCRIDRKSGGKNEEGTKAQRIARKTLILSTFSRHLSTFALLFLPLKYISLLFVIILASFNCTKKGPFIYDVSKRGKAFRLFGTSGCVMEGVWPVPNVCDVICKGPKMPGQISIIKAGDEPTVKSGVFGVYRIANGIY